MVGGSGALRRMVYVVGACAASEYIIQDINPTSWFCYSRRPTQIKAKQRLLSARVIVHESKTLIPSKRGEQGCRLAQTTCVLWQSKTRCICTL
jgi:hypothetical protein